MTLPFTRSLGVSLNRSVDRRVDPSAEAAGAVTAWLVGRGLGPSPGGPVPVVVPRPTLMRMIRTAFAWTTAACVTLVFAVYAHVGPVMVVVRPGNGLHYTDVLMGALATTAAMLVSRPR